LRRAVNTTMLFETTPVSRPGRILALPLPDRNRQRLWLWGFVNGALSRADQGPGRERHQVRPLYPLADTTGDRPTDRFTRERLELLPLSARLALTHGGCGDI